MDDHYHSTPNHHGETFCFDRGGHYEKVVDGEAQHNTIGGEFCGFEESDTAELAASKTRAGAIFSQVKNIAPLPDDTHEVDLQVYRLARPPDNDFSDAGYDFGIVEEVRYESPETHPVDGILDTRVTVPHQLVEDVRLVYLPTGASVLDDWAEAVKEGIEQLIETGEYPQELDAERPREDAHVDPFQQAYAATPSGSRSPARGD